MPPQRALARELKRRGHDVHVLTHDILAKTVSEDGGVFHALKTAVQWDAARSHSQGEEIAFIRQNVVGSSSYAADFLATYHALQPDVCVIDTMLITSVGAAIEHGLRFAVLNHLAWIEKGVVQGSLSSIAANLPGRSAGSTYFGLLSRVPLVLATSYPEFGTQTAIAPPRSLCGTDQGTRRRHTLAATLSGPTFRAGQPQHHVSRPGEDAAEHLRGHGDLATRGLGDNRPRHLARRGSGLGCYRGTIIRSARRNTFPCRSRRYARRAGNPAV